MAMPGLTREYTPGACWNSRKLMRLHTHHKMRPDSPELHAEEFHVPNKTRKEPRFPWWNTRETPRTLSQDEKNTTVTSKMQNRLVYPKSTKVEGHFPCIGSIAIHHSTSYTTVAWHHLGKFRDSLRHPSQVYRNINFSKATGWKILETHIICIWELIPCLRLKR